jgi:RNA polymerase sigma-70 factor (ECF subfamily)
MTSLLADAEVLAAEFDPEIVPDAASIDLAAALLAEAGRGAAIVPGAPSCAPTPTLAIEDIAQHRPALLRFARRKVRDEALAEDAVQDTLVAAVASADRFQGHSSVRTWLIGILHHKIQDIFRRETRYVSVTGDEDTPDVFDRLGMDLSDDTADPLRVVAGSQMRAALEREIDAMPATLKTVFRMQALEGLETAQVCEQLGISEANCWVRLHRARKHLSERMRGYLA